jgi:hypothetical protein
VAGARRGAPSLPRRLAGRRRVERGERCERACAFAFRPAGIAVDRDRDGRIGRGEFGLVDTANAPPSAAAGGTRAPKKPE